ncbi:MULTISPECIES: OsmC family protein [Micrococcaceae]|uniref:OsmC family protein n=1 Tax=Micrococcaceae TaxID=1268 RepID=UPI000AE3713A|nr:MULTISPECIES: OsmC family protein [Micrococcaceae]
MKNLHEHHYALAVQWTGNLGTGTSGYRDYSRDHNVLIPGLPVLKGSADPTFHGDRERFNPEQLLLAALAQCHMLSFLHVAVQHGVTVLDYRDEATGMMRLNRDGSGQFESVTLNPQVTVADAGQAGLAETLHHEANKVCFIARSVNFPVQHRPVTLVA